MDFGQSRLSGSSLGAFVNSSRKNRNRPKLVAETGLVVCQYDRLSQQQVSFLFRGSYISYLLWLTQMHQVNRRSKVMCML